MAVTPDGVLASFRALSTDEVAQVDKLERLADHFISDNYYDNGVVVWSVPELIGIDQVRELANRYRAVGWCVRVFSDEASTAMTFSKDGLRSDVIQSTGNVN